MSWHPLWIWAQNAESAVDSLLQSLENDVVTVADDNGARRRKVLSQFNQRGLICIEGAATRGHLRSAWLSAVDQQRTRATLVSTVRRELCELVQIILTSPPGTSSHFSEAGPGEGIFDTGRLMAKTGGSVLAAKTVPQLVAVLCSQATKVQILDRHFLSGPDDETLFRSMLGALARRDPQAAVEIEVLCGPRGNETDFGEETRTALGHVSSTIQAANTLANLRVNLVADEGKFRLHDRAIMFWITPSGGHAGSTKRALSLGQGAASMSKRRSVIVHELSTDAFVGVWNEISENCRIVRLDAPGTHT